jgi:LuxR family maltose regulon positive regulatory protein
MPYSVLKTKLYRPQVRAGVVSRRRLIDRLQAGMDGSLILLSAPAGFGKTTLICDWLSQLNEPSTWISLDEDDNELARFMVYFISALQRIEPGLGEKKLTAIQTSQALDPHILITDLINEVSSLDYPFVFVLEDYHRITIPEIHDVVSFLLEHIPRQMRLVINSRIDPPLPISRYRAERAMTEIRGADLCFSTPEAETFLNQTMDLGLPHDTIEALVTRTEGWIVGLQLAAVSMENLSRSERVSFIRAFTGTEAFILDYLVAEVINRQPETIKTFLLQTSILERLCGPLCETVVQTACQENPSPRPTGQEILEYLEHHNLFVVPLDNKRRWYRYHHLFTDLLRNQLEISEPQLVPRLHQRASLWYEKQHLLQEATIHSLAAQDYTQAATLIERSFLARMSHGEDFGTMLGRLQALPEEIIRARPNLGIWYAWMLSITLQLDAVEPRLKEIEDSSGDQLSEDHRLQIAVLRAEVARNRNDFPTAIETCTKVLETIRENPSNHILRIQARTGAVINLAWAYLLHGEMIKAQRSFSDALEISTAAGSITLILLALRGLALCYKWQGMLKQAVECCRRGLQRVSEESRAHYRHVVPAATYIYLEMGDLMREWNRLDEAADYLWKGIELGRRFHIDAGTLRDGYIAYARLKHARGDASAAKDIIEQAERLAEENTVVPKFGSPIDSLKVQLHLDQSAEFGDSYLGQGAKADEWADEHGLNEEARAASLNQETAYLVWVRLLIAGKDHAKALRITEALINGAEANGRAGRVIEVLILRALVLLEMSKHDEAIDALGRSLELAEPSGYMRIFADEGAPLAALLQGMAGHARFGDYAGRLLEAFQQEKQLSSSLQPRTAAQLIEPLSDREMEVLRFLPCNWTGAKIAEKLFVSANTIKTHLKNIYGKLGAHSRYEAVEKARKLNLLD